MNRVSQTIGEKTMDLLTAYNTLTQVAGSGVVAYLILAFWVVK